MFMTKCLCQTFSWSNYNHEGQGRYRRPTTNHTISTVIAKKAEESTISGPFACNPVFLRVVTCYISIEALRSWTQQQQHTPVDLFSILSKAEETKTNKGAPQNHILLIFKSEIQPTLRRTVKAY